MKCARPSEVRVLGAAGILAAAFGVAGCLRLGAFVMLCANVYALVGRR